MVISTGQVGLGAPPGVPLNDQPVGINIWILFAAADTTVAVIVIGLAFVPLVPIDPVDVAVGVIDAACAGDANPINMAKVKAIDEHKTISFFIVSTLGKKYKARSAHKGITP